MKRAVACGLIALVVLLTTCSKKGGVNPPPPSQETILEGTIAPLPIDASSLVVFSAMDSSGVDISNTYSLKVGADNAGAGEVLAACTPDGRPVLIGFWTAETRLDLNSASTATALVLLNPYFLGVTGRQLATLQSRIEAADSYLPLAYMITDALWNRGPDALIGDEAAPIYRLANQIATAIYTENPGLLTKTAHTAGTEDEAPTVGDAPGNDVEFVNPYSICYGIGIYPLPGGTRSNVVGLMGGDYPLTWPLQGVDPNHLVYPLGGGEFKIVIDKGGGRGIYPFSLDPSTEWGFASLANVAQGAWYVMSDILRVAGSNAGRQTLKGVLGSAEAKKLKQVAMDLQDVMDEQDFLRDLAAKDCVGLARDFGNMFTKDPKKIYRAFRSLMPTLPEASGSLIKNMSGVLEGVLGALDARDQLRYVYDLVLAPQGRSVTVMQTNGQLGPVQYLSLQSPNGGEKWVKGTTQTISWVRENIDNFAISYSTDGGANWNLIQVVTGDKYNWVVPDEVSPNCYVKVAEATDQFPADQSDATFSIVSQPDVTSPSAVSDLKVESPTTNSLLLTWSAPGDDGNTGTAWTYDIRYSTAAITGPFSWDLATGMTGEPKPRPAGTQEGFFVSGLSDGMKYYFAIKSGDYAANASQLSNVASGMTLSLTDLIPPSAISNWWVDDATTSSVAMGWVAPGDDGNTGTASQYDIRYSTASITASNWARATQVTGEPVPGVAGSPQSFVATGLKANTTYYFAIKTADEVQNWSSISSIEIAQTLPDVDTTPPATITDLAAGSATQNSITLTWKAPGDDGNIGTAAQYDIRYSTTTITTQSWEAATQVAGAPSPKLAGSEESYVVTGLLPNTTYYFAVKTADEVPNWSAISNIAIARTPPDVDTTPPAPVTDLAAGNATQNSITLTWTAPGDDGIVGAASQYDVRYSTASITEANWGTAAQVTGEPSPSGAGSAESFVVTGLSPNTTYYFAIKTADEIPNWSTMSNVAAAGTLSALGSLSVIGSVSIPGTYGGTGVAVSASYAYVVSQIDRPGLRVVDISDPSTPSIVGTFSGSLGLGFVDVQIAGNYLYVGGSYLIDVSIPSNPLQVSRLTGCCRTLIDGQRAYLGGLSRLSVLDISNPHSPTVSATLAIGLGAGDLAVVDGYLYATPMAQGGFYTIDVSDPAAPRILGYYVDAVIFYPGTVSAVPGYLFFLTGSSIAIFDVRTPLAPVFVRQLSYATAEAVRMTVEGKYGYLVGVYGLRVLDLSDPANPTLIAHYDIERASAQVWLGGVAVKEDRVYFMDWTNGALKILRFAP